MLLPFPDDLYAAALAHREQMRLPIPPGGVTFAHVRSFLRHEFTDYDRALARYGWHGENEARKRQIKLETNKAIEEEIRAMNGGVSLDAAD